MNEFWSGLATRNLSLIWRVVLKLQWEALRVQGGEPGFLQLLDSMVYVLRYWLVEGWADSFHGFPEAWGKFLFGSPPTVYIVEVGGEKRNGAPTGTPPCRFSFVFSAPCSAFSLLCPACEQLVSVSRQLSVNVSSDSLTLVIYPFCQLYRWLESTWHWYRQLWDRDLNTEFQGSP